MPVNGLRMKRTPPSSRSSALIALVNEGCEIPLRLAARPRTGLGSSGFGAFPCLPPEWLYHRDSCHSGWLSHVR
jgi:hypothetical protein